MAYYGRDDEQMWTGTEAEEIEHEANKRQHRFDCECPECARTKKMLILLRNVRLP